ncbi:MAG: hypothetical protein IPG71_08115 [bacterium]|nr:hypothetical protein [bacterium]
MTGLLAEPLTRLRQVGEHRAKALEKIGISSLGQLVRYYPRRYLTARGSSRFGNSSQQSTKSQSSVK